MPRKLLLLSASSGAGHNRAAEALREAAKELFPDVEVHYHDTLEFTGKLFAKLYPKSYLVAVNKMPALWGYFYAKTDRWSDKGLGGRAIDAFDQRNARKLANFVHDLNPDHVICTHFLPMDLLLTKRGRTKYNHPLSVVVTDYDVHKFWVHDGVDRYFVATDEVKWQLQRKGTPEKQIRVCGIPIHPVFSKKPDRAEVAARLGIRSDLPTVLVLSGGFGIGHIERVVADLARLPAELQLVVIAGRNEKLRQEVQAVETPPTVAKKVFGFVTNIQDFYASADLAVTKSGGLTVSECLAMGLPMVIFAPIPGQEERNCDYLLEQGAAVKAKDLATLEWKVLSLLRDPAARLRMAERAAATARARAAHDILKDVLGG
ncbi:MAG: glycosyltransferase [Planctomycetes bacterium]|nr:glycosyltransferase [Planctomycetota bacterium]